MSNHLERIIEDIKRQRDYVQQLRECGYPKTHSNGVPAMQANNVYWNAIHRLERLREIAKNIYHRRKGHNL